MSLQAEFSNFFIACESIDHRWRLQSDENWKICVLIRVPNVFGGVLQIFLSKIVVIDRCNAHSREKTVR